MDKARARLVIAATTRLAAMPIARRRPLSLAVRVAENRLIPWVARAAFRDGVQHVNGVRMVVPRPPDWGGGGEFHMALGTYERDELAFTLGRLRPGDTFVDIGAHIGYFALPAARRVGPRGRVIAVEPVASSAALLRRNVALNRFEHVEVVEAAASDRDGRAELRIAADSAMWATLRSDTFDHVAATVSVPTRSLDSVLAERGWPTVAGIKLDVEGAESDVLRGADEALRRNPSAFFLFEASGGEPGRVAASLETLETLAGRGYRFRRLTGRRLAPPVGARDLLPLLTSPNWHDHLFNVVAERHSDGPPRRATPPHAARPTEH